MNYKNNDLLQDLEARFQKKLDWMFYIIMAVILMVIVSNFYLLKERLIKSHKFWQRQVSKFEALILSIVILWFKSITKKLGTWLSPAG